MNQEENDRARCNFPSPKDGMGGERLVFDNGVCGAFPMLSRQSPLPRCTLPLTVSLPSKQDNGRSRTILELSNLPLFHGAAVRLLNISLDDSSALAEFEEVFKSDAALSAELLL